MAGGEAEAGHVLRTRRKGQGRGGRTCRAGGEPTAALVGAAARWGDSAAEAVAMAGNHVTVLRRVGRIL